MPMTIAEGKKKWMPESKPKMMKGTALNPNAAIELQYYSELRALILKMARETNASIEQLFRTPTVQQYSAADASISAEAQALMAALIEKFQAIFDLASNPFARRMTAQSSRASASALKTSLKRLSGGLTLKTDILSGELKDVFAATVAENVGLIKSIASEYLTQVQGAVMRSITTGRGLADLVPYLEKQQGVTLNRARIIARDQTAKAFSNINFSRMKTLGITQYQWLHSAGSQKPRKLHIAMSGKTYDIANPPIIDEKTGVRGKPGDLINCHCRAVPLVNFNER